MTSLPKRFAALALALLAAAGLAACAGSPTSPPSSGKPVYGGTLNIVAASGPDHLDPLPAYTPADYMLERGYTRQLLSYPNVAATTTSGAAWLKATTLVADVATEVPATSNGGISNGGKTYTFRIKPGVDWNTSPPRQVTAADFIREFKAFCNPAPGGFVGNIIYYESTIAGMTPYCNAETAYFGNAKAHPATAASIASFQNAHTISGLSAPSSLTLRFSLIQPASDFLYMLAMPFTSARPAEYDSYVPNSLQLDEHTISDGPYQITSYIPGKSMTLAKNPAWKPSTDPVRGGYVSKIVVTEGVTSAATQLADMQAGTEDLPMDTAINAASIPGLLASKVPNFHVWAGSDLYPDIVFNLRSPDAGGAMGKLLVRQAIEYGVNKVAVQKAFGGPSLTTISSTVIPPGNAGYVNSDMYPSADNEGNVAACKSDLARAGYPHGVTLIYLYGNDSFSARVFTAIQASLQRCGVTLSGKPDPGSSILTDLGNSPENNKPGRWDLGQAGYIPDWYGNNGRSFIGVQFQTDCVVNTSNYGCYSSPQMDSLIKQAETAGSASAAAADWRAADQLAMKNALIVPIQSSNFPLYASSRVRQAGASTASYSPFLGDPDITNVWLSHG